MPRTRIISDAKVFAAIRTLLEQGGDKAVSFASVAAATGLAPPTLVQRYGSRDGMVSVAHLAAWRGLEQVTDDAIGNTADKGPQALLKALPATEVVRLATQLRDPDLAQRATAWRFKVESALALRLGGGPKSKESAALLFAAWQGQALWSAGASAFRLKEAVKRLT